MGTITKRLHISGLTPSITPADLSARFSSFGTVRDLDAGGLDANGDPRRFAFLTLEAPEAHIKRCMNLLSNSRWKDAKLRVGEARPTFTARLELDHVKAEEKQKMFEERRKARALERRKRGRGAWEDRDLRVVDVRLAKRRKGWHITPASHLIRPVLLTPSHPLPPPSTSLTSSSTSSTSTTTSSKPKPPPRRLRPTLIDPRRYNALHLSGAMLGSSITDPAAGGLWVCEEAESEEGRVRWRRVEGGEEEEYELRGRKVVDVELGEPEGEPQLPSRARTQATPVEQMDVYVYEDEEQDDADADLFALLAAQRLRSERSPSPLFPTFHKTTRAPKNAPSSPLFPASASAAPAPALSPSPSPSPEFTPEPQQPAPTSTSPGPEREPSSEPADADAEEDADAAWDLALSLASGAAPSSDDAWADPFAADDELLSIAAEKERAALEEVRRRKEAERAHLTNRGTKPKGKKAEGEGEEKAEVGMEGMEDEGKGKKKVKGGVKWKEGLEEGPTPRGSPVPTPVRSALKKRSAVAASSLATPTRTVSASSSRITTTSSFLPTSSAVSSAPSASSAAALIDSDDDEPAKVGGEVKAGLGVRLTPDERARREATRAEQRAQAALLARLMGGGEARGGREWGVGGAEVD